MNCVEFLKEYDEFLFGRQKEPLPKEAAHHLDVCENCSRVATKLKSDDEESRRNPYPLSFRFRVKVRLIPLRRFCEEIDVWKVLCRTFPVIALGLPLAALGLIFLPDPLGFLALLGSLCLALHLRAIAISKRPPQEDPDLEPPHHPAAPIVSLPKLIAFAQGRLSPEDTRLVMSLAQGDPEVAHDLKLVTGVLKYAKRDEKKKQMLAVVSMN
jgi:hypothetical protein